MLDFYSNFSFLKILLNDVGIDLKNLLTILVKMWHFKANFNGREELAYFDGIQEELLNSRRNIHPWTFE